jgi:hypothetical protein
MTLLKVSSTFWPARVSVVSGSRSIRKVVSVSGETQRLTKTTEDEP